MSEQQNDASRRAASGESTADRSAAESRPRRPAGASPSARVTLLLAALVIPLAVAVAAFSLLRDDPLGSRPGQTPARFKLDLRPQLTVAEDMLGYTQQRTFTVQLADARSIAVGADDSVYVAGDRMIQILDPDGSPRGQIQLEVEPTCLAVAGDDADQPGRLYVGSSQGVLVYGPDGAARGGWPSLGDDALLTAIDLALDEVFVADAGNRLVLRYDAEGQLLGRIGATSPERSMPGFVIPSPYFDLVVGPDMFVHVVNPGARRVECYTFDGQLQGFWGTGSSALEGFFGCCNPAHLARTRDGRFVTSEKGIPRVKVYSELGDFQTVVAGPAELDVDPAELGDARGNQAQRVFDVAVNGQGEVLVLDSRRRRVRVYAPKGADGEQMDAEQMGAS
jgi:hypothetical protein